MHILYMLGLHNATLSEFNVSRNLEKIPSVKRSEGDLCSLNQCYR